jgi:YggT family protein
MPSDYFSNPLSFLIDTLLSIYMGIVALRIIMQWAQWDYHNQLVQLIIKATQIPVKFLRKFIPAIGRWDTATIVLLFALALLKIILISSINIGFIPDIFILARLILADIFSLFITLFSASIIIQVILSWIAPNQYNPITPLISRMNAPLLHPVRRWLPDMGGLDLSPLVVLLGLQVLSMLVLPLLVGHS